MKNEFDGSFDSIGATTYAIGTIKVNFPLGLPEAFGLEGAVFSDFGTAFGAPENSETGLSPDCFGPLDTPPGDGDCEVVGKDLAFRASVGAGVIWASPFGPLRLDVAYPLAILADAGAINDAHAGQDLRGERDPEAGAFLGQEFMRHLHQYACAVARERVRADGTTVGQALVDRQTLADNLVTLLTLDMGNETDTAGVVFVCRIVKPLSGRQ